MSLSDISSWACSVLFTTKKVNRPAKGESMPGSNLLKSMTESLPPAAKLAFAAWEEKLLLSCGECHGLLHQGVRTASIAQWKQTHFLSERTESSWVQAQGLFGEGWPACHSSLPQGTVTSCIYSLTELYVLRTLRRILRWAPWVKKTERSLWPLKRILVTVTQMTPANFSSSRINLISIIFIHLYWESKIEKCLKWESSSPIIYSFKHVLFIFLPL